MCHRNPDHLSIDGEKRPTSIRLRHRPQHPIPKPLRQLSIPQLHLHRPNEWQEWTREPLEVLAWGENRNIADLILLVFSDPVGPDDFSRNVALQIAGLATLANRFVYASKLESKGETSYNSANRFPVFPRSMKNLLLLFLCILRSRGLRSIDGTDFFWAEFDRTNCEFSD
jgi:hypothetical protein